MKITEEVYIVGSGQMGLSAPLDCHIYLIRDDDEAFIIDAGAGKYDSDVNFIIKNIENDGINLNKIRKLFLTHAHSDHSGGAIYLKDKLGCEIVANKVTKKYVEKGDEHELGLDFARRSGFYGDAYRFKTFTVDRVIEDGETMRVANSRITAIHTPGHSMDSTCYLFQKNNTKMLFTGDVLNHGGKILLLNCYGFSMDDYRENIKKLANLSIDMLFPGHGIFTLKNGQSHVDMLIDAFDKLLINGQLIL